SVNSDYSLDRDVTGAEALAASALSMAATAIVAAYLVYRAGFTVAPSLVLLVAVLAAAASGIAFGRRAVWQPADAIGVAAVFAGVFLSLLWVARPTLMPIGGGVDLAHHLVLIDHLARRWQLIDDPSLVPYLG